MKCPKLNCLYICIAVFSSSSYSDSEHVLLELVEKYTLEELVNIKISAPSMRDEKLKDAPGIVNVITQNDIKYYQANNLLDLLARLPSITNGSTGRFQSNTINIRGHEFTQYNTHVLYLLNGRPIRGGITNGLMEQVINGIPLSAIKQIEVIRGPGSVLYGTNAFSGVINIKTVLSDKAENGKWVAVEGGNLGYKKVELGANVVAGNTKFGIAIKYSESDGERYRYTDVDNITLTPNWYDENLGILANALYHGFNFKVARFRREAFRIQGGFRWQLSIPDELTLADVEDPNIFSQSNIDNYEHDLIDLGYKLEIVDGHQFNAHYTRNKVLWWFLDRLDNTYSTADLFELKFLGNITKKLDYIVGVVTEENTTLPSSATVEGESSYDTIYWQSTYSPIEKLKLVAGFQRNKPEGLNSHFTPRLGFIYHFDNAWSVKLLYGEAFRSAANGDLFGATENRLSNPNLRPETVKTTDISVNYQGASSNVSLTLYRSKVDSLLTRINVVDEGLIKSQTTNGLGVDYQGVEFDSKFNFSSHFSIFANASWQTNEDQATGEKDAIVFPKYMLKSGFVYKTGSYSFSIDASYLDAPPATGNNQLNPASKDLLTINSALNIDLSQYIPRSTIKFSMANLLNEDMWNPDYHRRRLDTTKINRRRSASLEFLYEF